MMQNVAKLRKNAQSEPFGSSESLKISFLDRKRNANKKLHKMV